VLVFAKQHVTTTGKYSIRVLVMTDAASSKDAPRIIKRKDEKERVRIGLVIVLKLISG